MDDIERTESGAAEAEVREVVRVPVDDVLDRVLDDPAGEWNLAPLLAAGREGYLDL